jgi:hypothetical protein
MILSPDAIAAIARWDSAHPGFGRDDPQTRTRIEAIADRVRESGEVGCDVLDDDGLSNYFVLFTYAVADVPSFPLAHKVEGLLIYLSACAPVGVAGHSCKCVGESLRSFDPLGTGDLIDNQQLHGGIEKVAFDAIRAEGYELLSMKAVNEPIPPGIEPFEYCRVPHPWDRVFHGLFANTD